MKYKKIIAIASLVMALALILIWQGFFLKSDVAVDVVQNYDTPEINISPTDSNEDTSDTPDAPVPNEDPNEDNVSSQEIQNTEIDADIQISGDAAYSEANGMEIDAVSGTDKFNTEPVPEGKPVPAEPQDTEINSLELTCTLSVRCDTVLNNMSALNPDKADIIPQNGVIFEERTVKFYDGESVFNLLVREMKRNKIHMEFVNTPFYNSAYIEGIGNLYEFDCGELSGWMYKVNGWFPNYGCSRYKLCEGDKVEWVYSCDLGEDVGGKYAGGNGKNNETE